MEDVVRPAKVYTDKEEEAFERYCIMVDNPSITKEEAVNAIVRDYGMGISFSVIKRFHD